MCGHCIIGKRVAFSAEIKVTFAHLEEYLYVPTFSIDPTEGFLRAAFQFLHTFHGFHPCTQGSASLCSLFRDLFNDTAEFTLCYGLHDCSHLFQGYFIHSLSTLYYYNAPSLATRLTGDYRDRTFTGKCGPASLDTRNRNSPLRKGFLLSQRAN